MIGAVKGRADQVIHRGIKNDKALGFAFFDLHDA